MTPKAGTKTLGEKDARESRTHMEVAIPEDHPASVANKGQNFLILRIQNSSSLIRKC
jgi:hypothetical protein